ncbi:MAG TPA: bifunctional riboflavin kinase/FAD synthetase [Methylomirabilota bacterium]|nr:bifunctional riboflavin kinase/FAD synthetase [Methylomirabilota bacterium]
MSLAVFSSASEWRERYQATGRGSTIAIGNFDGIHLGHQAILGAALARARVTGEVATAVTFDPPPLKVLRPEAAPPRLSTNAQRLTWFAAGGLEAAVVLPFTLELSRMAPAGFVEEVLVRGLCMKAIFVGENFRFGHKHAGNPALLKELAARHGYEVTIVPPVHFRGETVSSTVIRREIACGNVGHAARLLGRPFVLTGAVVAGTGTGRRFTFPTLNLAPEQELLPAQGVYITRTKIGGVSYDSVTNIGRRPTFDGKTLTVETHLLGHSGGVDPAEMKIRFCKRLRDEKKFAGPEELRTQIAQDVARATRFFARLAAFHKLRQAV